MSDTLMKKVRLQDIVAKTSGVNLEQTIKVILALGMVTEALCEDSLSTPLHFLLQDSARSGNEPAKLLSVPGQADIEACEDAYDVLWKRYGPRAMKNVKTLREDPYYAAARKTVT